MNKITLGIDGMMCNMCESHVNDAIRRSFAVENVTSSHKKGETVIITDYDITRDALERAIASTGYKVTGYKCEPYEKKGFFSAFRK